MTTLTEQLLRHAIGYDTLLKNANATNFPPYNIEQVSDDLYRLTLAVAGYSKEEIEILEHQGNLIIKGSKAEEPANNFLHRGIAFRDWSRTWKLEDYVRVVKAEFTNGLLIVDLERVIPEEAKPKHIPIN